jgi:hypothetical protein
MNEQQVTDIWAGVLSKVKDHIKEGVLSKGKDGMYPELWPGYNRAIKQRHQLMPHIVQGEFPDHLFAERAPNQTERELAWLKANFKPVTLPVFSDLKNTVGRALHERNWALEFAENPASEDVEAYVTEGIKEWGSLANFVKSAGISTMLQDAMGVLAFLPTAIPAIEQEDGSMVMDPDGVMDPDIHYYECENVWGFEYDKWYLFNREEKSMVQWGNATKPWGLVLYLVDDEKVWRIEQTGRMLDWTFSITEEFTHGVGFPPCIHWGGEAVYRRNRLVWESPYLAVAGILDIAMLQEHYLRASEAKCVYPHTVVMGSACDFVDKDHHHCDGGHIKYMVGDREVSQECPSCKGSGWKTRLSPMGQLVINPNADQMGADSTTIDASNALAFISPSVDTVRYIWERYEGNIKAARSIMHLDAEAPMVGGDAKTATEVGLNARAKDAFVKPIADRLFVIKDFAVMCIGKMRHGKDWQDYVLRPPSHYDLRTDADLLAEIAEAIERRLPPPIIDYLTWQYVQSRYGNDPEAMDNFSVVLRADRLQTMDWQAIQTEAAAGRVQAWEILLHFAGMGIWEKMTAQDPRLKELEVTEQVDRLIEQAKAGDQPVAEASAPMRNLMRVVGGSMSAPAPMPAPEQAPAPAREGAPADESVQEAALNGAQVTSLVNIINQVSLGVITKETARPLLKAAFPAVSDDRIAQMLNGIKAVDPNSAAAQAIK